MPRDPSAALAAALAAPSALPPDPPRVFLRSTPDAAFNLPPTPVAVRLTPWTHALTPILRRCYQLENQGGDQWTVLAESLEDATDASISWGRLRARAGLTRAWDYTEWLLTTQRANLPELLTAPGAPGRLTRSGTPQRWSTF